MKLKTTGVLVALALVAGVSVVPATSPTAAHAVSPLYVGPKEFPVSEAASGMTAWVDGTMGVVNNGSSYTFIAPNVNKTARTVGTLDNPVATSVSGSISIGSMKNTYDYAAGGPVYKDPTSGALLMVYHAEIWPGGNYAAFYSLLGMAKSTDDGATWTDLGEIIRLDINYATSGNPAMDLQGGSFVVKDGYFYVYYKEYPDTLATPHLAVARASVSSVVAAAVNTTNVVSWTKYYNGSWSEPGIGGHADNLWPGAPNDWEWSAVSYNTYLQKFIFVTNQFTSLPSAYWTRMIYMDSSDGITWSTPQTLWEDAGHEDTYMTIVGLGKDPNTSGAQFYVYYNSSQWKGGSRWNGNYLARKLISLTTPVVRGSSIYSASSQFSSTQGTNGWTYQSDAGGGYSNMTWNSGLGVWKGTGTYSFIGADWMHPNGTEDSVRNWTAPRAGTASAAGRIYKPSNALGGDGINAKVLVNSTAAYSQNLGGSDQVGYAFSVSSSVAASDTLRFRVNQLTNATSDGTQFDPLVYFTPSALWDPQTQFSSTQGTNQWSYQYWDGSAYGNLTYSSGWKKTGCDYCHVTADYMHPGTGYDVVRKWVAPSAGTIVISGNVRKIDVLTAGGDGVNAQILKNATSLYNQDIATDNEAGYNYSLTTTVAAGDILYFKVNKRGNTNGDSTGWDTTVVYQ